MGEARHKQWQRIRAKRRKLLTVAFAVAEAMFFVQIAVGITAMSVALQIDALETSDSGAATDSVLGKQFSDRYSNLATFFGGLFALLLCIWVVLAATWNYLSGTVPNAGLMVAVGTICLISNGIILLLLHRDRDGGENMRSAWRSARNDAIGNGAVIAAAAGTYFTGQSWPDMLAAGAILPFAIYQAVTAMRSRQ